MMSQQDSDNPYKAPVSDEPGGFQDSERRPGFIAIAVVVAASTCAAGIAFFFSCLGLISVDGTRNASPAVFFLVCFGAMLTVYLVSSRLGIAAIIGWGRRRSPMNKKTASSYASARIWGALILSVFAIGFCFFVCGSGVYIGPIPGFALAVTAGATVIWAMLGNPAASRTTGSSNEADPLQQEDRNDARKPWQ